MTPTAPTVPCEAPETEEARFDKQQAATADRPAAGSAEPAAHAPAGVPEFMPMG